MDWNTALDFVTVLFLLLLLLLLLSFFLFCQKRLGPLIIKFSKLFCNKTPRVFWRLEEVEALFHPLGVPLFFNWLNFLNKNKNRSEAKVSWRRRSVFGAFIKRFVIINGNICQRSKFYCCVLSEKISLVHPRTFVVFALFCFVFVLLCTVEYQRCSCCFHYQMIIFAFANHDYNLCCCCVIATATCAVPFSRIWCCLAKQQVNKSWQCLIWHFGPGIVHKKL